MSNSNDELRTEAILKLVYFEFRNGLKDSLLGECEREEAARVAKGALRKVARSHGFERLKLGSLRYSSDTKLKTLPRESFWKLQVCTPYVLTSVDTKSKFQPFDFIQQQTNKGICVAYKISLSFTCNAEIVEQRDLYRRYSEFDKLRNELLKEFKYKLHDNKTNETHNLRPILVPQLPPKTSFKVSSRFDSNLICERITSLTCWLDYITKHRVLELSEPLNRFLLGDKSIEASKLRALTEERVSKQLLHLREDKLSPNSKLNSLHSLYPGLKKGMRLVLEGITACCRAQCNLRYMKGEICRSLCYLTEVYASSKSLQDGLKSRVLHQEIRVFSTVVKNTFCPLKLSALDPLVVALKLFALDVIPNIHNYVNNRLSVGIFGKSDTEIMVLECEQVEHTRYCIFLNRIEEMIEELLANAQKTIEAYQELFRDLSNWPESINEELKLEGRYRQFEIQMREESLHYRLLSNSHSSGNSSIDLGFKNADSGASSLLNNAILNPVRNEYPKNTTLQENDKQSSMFAVQRLKASHHKRISSDRTNRVIASKALNKNKVCIGKEANNSTKCSTKKMLSNARESKYAGIPLGNREDYVRSNGINSKFESDTISKELRTRRIPDVLGCQRQPDDKLIAEISQWKRLALVEHGGLDLAGLLASLPKLLDVKRLRIEEFCEKKITAATLRKETQELRRVYRSVIRRIHPDKLRKNSTKQDYIRCREIFLVLTQFLEI